MQQLENSGTPQARQPRFVNGLVTALRGHTSCLSPCVYVGMYDLLPNTPLAERMQAHLERVGVPSWTIEEQSFARECQKQVNVAEKDWRSKCCPWFTNRRSAARPTLPTSVGTRRRGHRDADAAAGHFDAHMGGHRLRRHSIGLKGALAATKVLALAAIDGVTDVDLRKAARRDFERRTKGFTYQSPLPPDQKHPFVLPAWLNSDGSTEAMVDMARQLPTGRTR